MPEESDPEAGEASASKIGEALDPEAGKAEKSGKATEGNTYKELEEEGMGDSPLSDSKQPDEGTSPVGSVGNESWEVSPVEAKKTMSAEKIQH